MSGGGQDLQLRMPQVDEEDEPGLIGLVVYLVLERVVKQEHLGVVVVVGGCLCGCVGLYAYGFFILGGGGAGWLAGLVLAVGSGAGAGVGGRTRARVWGFGQGLRLELGWSRLSFLPPPCLTSNYNLAISFWNLRRNKGSRNGILANPPTQI